MEEWVDCIRHKLSEMGILNPKGNLYTKMTPTKTRNPMSPLPQPPSEENVENLPLGSNTNVARSRTSIVDVLDQQNNNNTNQSFTTSIYLNQDSSATSGAGGTSSGSVNPVQPVNTTRSAETVTVTPPAVSTSTTAATSVSTVTTQGATGATSSVYLNKSNPTRHVTVIPINKAAKVSFNPHFLNWINKFHMLSTRNDIPK